MYISTQKIGDLSGGCFEQELCKMVKVKDYMDSEADIPNVHSVVDKIVHSMTIRQTVDTKFVFILRFLILCSKL